MTAAALLSKIPPDILLDHLNRTDEFAVENVMALRGGPFGASLMIFDLKTGETTPIGEIVANAVISTGVGSAHAENEVMSPRNIKTLKKELAERAGDDVVVVLSSSGQGCPACHAKQEILARTLEAESLLGPGRFIVTYGATYKETFEIAGFNDEPYHLDMGNPMGTGLVKIFRQSMDEIPPEVRDVFRHSRQAVAAILQNHEITATGHDGRKHDLMATAEVSAIRSACLIQKQMDKETPWNLGEATLYTSTSSVGPLGYAECQWANVTQWVTVDHSGASELATQEAPGIDNEAFFQVVASRPYNGPGAAIHVMHIAEGFKNKAQKTWKTLLNKKRLRRPAALSITVPRLLEIIQFLGNPEKNHQENVKNLISLR